MHLMYYRARAPHERRGALLQRIENNWAMVRSLLLRPWHLHALQSDRLQAAGLQAPLAENYLGQRRGTLMRGPPGRARHSARPCPQTAQPCQQRTPLLRGEPRLRVHIVLSQSSRARQVNLIGVGERLDASEAGFDAFLSGLPDTSIWQVGAPGAWRVHPTLTLPPLPADWHGLARPRPPHAAHETCAAAAAWFGTR